VGPVGHSCLVSNQVGRTQRQHNKCTKTTLCLPKPALPKPLHIYPSCSAFTQAAPRLPKLLHVYLKVLHVYPSCSTFTQRCSTFTQAAPRLPKAAPRFLRFRAERGAPRRRRHSPDSYPEPWPM